MKTIQIDYHNFYQTVSVQNTLNPLYPSCFIGHPSSKITEKMTDQFVLFNHHGKFNL